MSQLLIFEEKNLPCSSHNGPKTPGAYVIEHGSGKMYVGSTNDLYRREIQHRHRLKSGTHKNEALQKAYDADPHYTYKVVTTDNREEAFQIEQSIIKQQMSVGTLFNVALDAKVSNKGLTRSEEVIKRASLARLGVRHSDDHKRNAMYGNPKRMEVSVGGVEFPSIKAASRTLGIHDQTVSRRINSDDPKYLDWRYVGDEPDFVIVYD